MTARVLAALTLLALLGSPAFAADAPDASALFAGGQAALTKGDLSGAFKAFAAAARAAPENMEYRQQAMLLKKVIRLRKHVSKAEPDARWQLTVRSLHVYFVGRGLNRLALDLDREAHGRAPSALTASLLGEVLLEAGENAEAAKLLTDVEKSWLTPENLVYRGIANARLGKKDAAKADLVAVATDGITPGLRFDLARLHVLLGEIDAGVRHLTLCFEAVTPSQLEAWKKHAKECPDLKVLAKTDALTKLLAVKSKVEESDCSGGSGCGSCPSRGSCGKADGK